MQLATTAPTCQHSTRCGTAALTSLTYAFLRESGYTGPVVIDAAGRDAYVAAAVLW